MKKILMIILVMMIPALALADIEVGPGRDYEMFSEAVAETEDDITVYPGTYDIRQEYLQLWNDDPPEQHRLGLFLKDRKITFLPGAKLTCVWYRDDNFSVIYSGGNVILEGMDLYAEGMRYAIHDDLWHWEEPYVNVYSRCRVVGRYLKIANCIGGGVARNARIIIDSCWFDNGVKDSITVRYHNTNLEGAEGDIWISDSFFNGWLALCYYGTTAHINVYVNGCRAEKILTKHETDDSTAENIDLYKWNNDD